MKQTALLVAAALLLTLCLSAASYFVCANHSYTIGYSDLQIDEYHLEGNTLRSRSAPTSTASICTR